ncbi:MAG: hypothetical protein PHQ27_11185, partial [Victivallales bacterium]|nr:hypothetical protein [Victivallales bacterium]
ERETIIACLLESGLAENRERAERDWQSAVALEERAIERDWPRRQQQILSGNSKFCHRVRIGGRDYFLRQTAFYRPIFQYSHFRVPEHLGAGKEYSRPEAQNIWLDSFYAQLRHESRPQVPLIWELRPQGDDLIYYAVGKEEKRLCGF